MAKSFSELPKHMLRVKRALPIVVDKIAKQAGTVLTKELIDETPVDTGAARSNWIAQRGTPFIGMIPPHVPLPQSTNPAKKVNDGGNGAVAKTLANGVIRGFNSKRDRRLWITNNVRNPRNGFGYMGTLNDGRSVQSRALWINRAFESGVNSIRKFPFVLEICNALRRV